MSDPFAATAGRVRVLFNPKSGGNVLVHGAKVDEASLRRLLEQHGINADYVTFDDEQNARAAVREARDQRYATVVAAGGDGTVGLVATEVIGSETAVGILPLGTVMNVARQLGIPRELEAAAQILAAGHRRCADIGVANGEPFFESAAVGLSAAVLNQMSKSGDRNWRQLPRAIRQAFRYRPRLMRAQLDRGEIRARALMVTVSIGPYLAAGMTVAPDAKLDDGKFDVTVFRHFSKKELARHMFAIAFGRHAYSPHTRVYRSKTVRITADGPLPARADGRDLGNAPIDFAVRPGALLVIAAPRAETFSTP